MNLYDYYEHKANLLDDEMLEFTRLKESFSYHLKRAKTIEEKQECENILADIKEDLKKIEEERLAIEKAYYNLCHPYRGYKYYQELKNNPFFPWDGEY